MAERAWVSGTETAGLPVSGSRMYLSWEPGVLDEPSKERIMPPEVVP